MGTYARARRVIPAYGGEKPSLISHPPSRLAIHPATAAIVAVLLGTLLGLTACGSDEPATTTGTAGGESSGERISLVDDGDALRWGDGSYGVVLAHGAAFDAASWQDQAEAMADQGNSVVAVEDLTPEAMTAAVDRLRDEGAESVALVGGSAGADAALRLLAQDPDLVDQVVTLSANSTVEGLGDQPKLFIASEDESVADVATELAESAPGDNDVLLLPGSAHAQHVFDGDQAEPALEALLDAVALQRALAPARRSPAAAPAGSRRTPRRPRAGRGCRPRRARCGG